MNIQVYFYKWPLKIGTADLTPNLKSVEQTQVLPT